MGQRSGGDLQKGPIVYIAEATLFAVMAIAVAIVWAACVKQTNGFLTYTLDDPYIHLAIAKNFAHHGVWGVTEYANASASSSPLWTGLLALIIKIGTDYVYWPFWFGILFSALATRLVYKNFQRQGMALPVALVAALAIFLAGPLHVLPFTGMEHSLQIFLDLLFLFWLIATFQKTTTTNNDLIVAVALPALMCLARYESIFLIVIPTLNALIKRQWKLAAALAAGPIVGIGSFALFSLAVGMPAIPNSIMIKGNLPKTGAGDFFSSVLWRIRALMQAESLTLSDLLMFAIANGLILRLKPLRTETGPVRTAIWTAVTACILHASLASFGWFFRYEAYLVVLLATVNVLAWHRMLAYRGAWEKLPAPKKVWIATIVAICAAQFVLTKLFSFLQLRENLLIVVAFFGLAGLAALDRGENTRGRLARTVLIWLVPLSFFFMIQDRPLLAYTQAPGASRDIYTQQVQMARFIDKYYPKGRLAANDIGAVTYFSHVHLLDLYGLATDEIRRQKLARRFGTESLGIQIQKFDPDVVIAYPNWFVGDHKFPEWLIPVANWKIPPVTSAGGDTVTFYATTPEKAARIVKQVVEFQPYLPKEVKLQLYVQHTKLQTR